MEKEGTLKNNTRQKLFTADFFEPEQEKERGAKIDEGLVNIHETLQQKAGFPIIDAV